MEILENASDYGGELERLNNAWKGIVRQLCEIAGNKQKCTFICVFLVFWLTKGPETNPKEKKKDVSGPSAPQTISTKKERETLNQHIEIQDWYHTNGKNLQQILIHSNDRDYDVDNDASIEAPPMLQKVHLATSVIN